MSLALLAAGAPASAQIFGPGQWARDMYLVERAHEFPFPKALIDEENRIRLAIPSVAKAIGFPVPQSRLGLSMRSLWHKDALYTVAYGGKDTYEDNEDGSKFKHCTFAKWQDDGWQFLGDYKTDTEIDLIAIPCDRERFIVISANGDLAGNNALTTSPFHRMSIPSGKKELRLDDLMDHGMDEIRNHMSGPNCFNMAFNGQIAMTDDYATIVDSKTGLYWIFSLEKASLKHTGKIFKNVTPDMIAKGGFPNAILRVHPEKNGTILISAQEEAAFLTETGDVTKEIQEQLEKNPDLSPEDIYKLIRSRSDELASRNPLLVWYRIDPENGKAEKLGVPPVGAAFVRDGTKNDYWRPMPDGSVRMGSLDPYLKADAEVQQTKTQQADGQQTKAQQHEAAKAKGNGRTIIDEINDATAKD